MKPTQHSPLRALLASVPLLGWLLGALTAVLLESFLGAQCARILGLEKVPVMFGLQDILKDVVQSPATIGYVLAMYLVPAFVVALGSRGLTNRLATAMAALPVAVPAVVHLLLTYAVLHIWTEMSDYQLVTVKFTLIAVLATLSCNITNGYLGEFACSHPGFMALGAYVTSVFSMGLFANTTLYGAALLPESMGHFMFPVGLIIGGIVAALGALIVAIPSFKTRGDYLAIISLAFLFIVKSSLENLDIVGGPSGMNGQPDFATLPMVFGMVLLGVWVINNFVTSTLGKGLNAVRDDETAAEALTVDTRRIKMIAFLMGAFWAGVAGGLFAHVLRFVNPSTFGVQKLAEILAMVYFGGLNSVYGSIVGAVSISMLSEMLRPLEVLKWVVIPLMLILVTVFRPTGLVAFKDVNLRSLLGPRTPEATGGKTKAKGRD
ncbi:branched-chain amino acid ABC transporter permease [Megalodesulfovibrio paquesii]